MTRATILRTTGIVLLAAALTYGHWFYSWWVSMRLYQWSGGIRRLPDGWTEFGGTAWAWAIPLELPGTAILRLCQIHTNSDCNGTLSAQVGLSLTLLPSFIVAYLIAVALIRLITGRSISWGRWYWRAVVVALGLVWIPVRADFAPVFQYTVMY